MDLCNELLFDINEFDEDNLIFIKPMFFYKINKNIGIYYKPEKNINKKFLFNGKQKIILQTPKMYSVFGVKKLVYSDFEINKLALSFSTITNLYNDENIKKFFNFVKKVDTVTEEIISYNRKKWNLPKKISLSPSLFRTSEKYSYYMNIFLPIDKNETLFHVYNENNEKSSIDIIDSKSIVTAVLELTDIKFTDSKYYINWKVLQLKKCKKISIIQELFLSCCFVDDKIITDKTKHIIEHKSSEYKEPVTKQSNHNDICIFKPPSLDELLDAKKLLKKTKTNVKILATGKIIDKVPKAPVLKLKKT